MIVLADLKKNGELILFIRVYMQASTEVEATTYLQKLLNLGERVKLSLKKEKCEPFLDTFAVELEAKTASEKQVNELLESIAPKWNQLPNSFIATEKETELHIHHVEMIEVYPEI